MNIRVLLVEPNTEDAVFLKDVLSEIEAERLWKPYASIETIQASTWPDAAAILAHHQIDLLLLDQNLDTLRRAQQAAPHVPIILLTSPDDDETPVQLIREGAQDFLTKRDIDCQPLAHAMRNAIERQRLLNSAHASSMIDALTGLPNRSAFISIANRDRKLAEGLQRRFMLLLAEIPGGLSQQKRDLSIIEAADHLRSVISPTDILARLSELRFGIGILETNADPLELIWSRFHAAAESHHIRIGAAIFDPDRPASLDALLDHAAVDLAPTTAVAARQ